MRQYTPIMTSSPTLHTMSVAQFLGLPLDRIIDGLPRFLASYVIPDPEVQKGVIDAISPLQTGSSREEWAALVEHMQTLGESYGFYARDALAEKIAEGYMVPLLEASSTIAGLENLDRAVELADSGRRVMIVGNHLSYADTMSLRSMLSRRGRHDAVSRITAVAGPKVYAEPMRRLAVAGIHSIKVAQSSTLSTNEQEAMTPRELVRISKMCMKAAEESMDAGRFVLIYPEGTRARPGAAPDYKPAGTRAFYKSLKLPLVPLATNAGLCWPAKGITRRPGTIVYEVLPPLPSDLNPKAMLAELETHLEAGCNRLLEEGLTVQNRTRDDLA